jgi:CelD/BcsL family acetyltransferase involved in cellulose biosynthesis
LGSFEDYWKARGKNLRQNLPKLRRRLEERGATPKFEFLERPTEVDAAFADYAKLESASWKAENGTAISTENQQGKFYRQVLKEYAQRRSAFAVRMSHEGRPIAVDFGVRDAECMVVLKTTYDEGYRAFSPAQLLHEQAFAHVFRKGLARRIEFYGKLMEWHMKWTDQSRMLFHVNYYRSPLVRTARDLLRRTRRWARPLINPATSG